MSQRQADDSFRRHKGETTTSLTFSLPPHPGRESRRGTLLPPTPVGDGAPFLHFLTTQHSQPTIFSSVRGWHPTPRAPSTMNGPYGQKVPCRSQSIPMAAAHANTLRRGGALHYGYQASWNQGLPTPCSGPKGRAGGPGWNSWLADKGSREPGPAIWGDRLRSLRG